MQRKILMMLSALGGALLLGLASGAHADQITFGPSTSGSLAFTGNGAGSVTIATSGLSGDALFSDSPSDLGTFALGNASFTAGPVHNGLFPTSGTQSFSYTSTSDSDSLSGTVTWNTIQDNTPQPKFYGTVQITAVAGDTSFTNAFGAGKTAAIDFITNPLSSGGTLDELAWTTRAATATISDGQVAAVPEPGSLVLFGFGLMVLCAYLRGKLSEPDAMDLAA